MDSKYEIQPYQEVDFLDYIFHHLEHQRKHARTAKLAKLDLVEINDRFFDFRKAILRTIPDTNFTPTTVPLGEQPQNILVANNTGNAGKHRAMKATAPVSGKRRSTSSTPKGLVKRAVYQPKVNVCEAVKIFLLQFEAGSRAKPGELIAPNFADAACTRYMLVFSQDLSIRSRSGSSAERFADLNTIVHVPVNKLPLIGNPGLYDTYAMVVLVPEHIETWHLPIFINSPRLVRVKREDDEESESMVVAIKTENSSDEFEIEAD